MAPRGKTGYSQFEERRNKKTNNSKAGPETWSSFIEFRLVILNSDRNLKKKPKTLGKTTFQQYE